MNYRITGQYGPIVKEFATDKAAFEYANGMTDSAALPSIEKQIKGCWHQWDVSNERWAKKQPKYKTVEWSYPTSGNANRFHMKDGCWTVETIAEDWMPNAIRGFNSRAEAIMNACVIALPWSPLFLRFNPLIPVV